MADSSMRITNFPDSGSPEAVAFKLYDRLDAIIPKQADPKIQIMRHLALYRSCLQATRGVKPETPDIS